MSKIGKIKKVEDKKVINEDYEEEFSFKKFIGIIIIILVILGIFYFITTLTAKRQENNVERISFELGIFYMMDQERNTGPIATDIIVDSD